MSEMGWFLLLFAQSAGMSLTRSEPTLTAHHSHWSRLRLLVRRLGVGGEHGPDRRLVGYPPFADARILLGELVRGARVCRRGEKRCGHRQWRLGDQRTLTVTPRSLSRPRRSGSCVRGLWRCRAITT